MTVSDHVQIDHELLLEFFLLFSYFEFELKNNGFARGDLERIAPEWDRFILSVENDFDSNYSSGIREAFEFFELNPPMRQVLINGSPGWSSFPWNLSHTDFKNLINCVRTVRNNLFHGGKFNNELFESSHRTTLLLTHSIVILNECIRLSG
jgi:hypothetical protein